MSKSKKGKSSGGGKASKPSKSSTTWDEVSAMQGQLALLQEQLQILTQQSKKRGRKEKSKRRDSSSDDSESDRAPSSVGSKRAAREEASAPGPAHEDWAPPETAGWTPEAADWTQPEAAGWAPEAGTEDHGHFAPEPAPAFPTQDFPPPPPSSSRPKPKKVKTGRTCEFCQITVTPTWRSGPHGSGTLCNACGVKWKAGRIVEAEDGTLRYQHTATTLARQRAQEANANGGVKKPRQKKPKAVLTVTYEQKRELSLAIEQLGNENSDRLATVVEIIRRGMPGIGETDEIELDMDIMDQNTLLELWRFIKGTDPWAAPAFSGGYA
ncbi:hypothetical protein DFJ74DRAFT_650668 [Hyaloraphidium curvatum]|nr:hypothetical protein DFJ74DRAFT_650668 [Hyaloraphidium curvatum]